MRDLWLICERCCCEEPCLIFIGGGGQTCERQQRFCVTHNENAVLEWWRPLTKEDIEYYLLELRGMDDPFEGAIVIENGTFQKIEGKDEQTPRRDHSGEER